SRDPKPAEPFLCGTIPSDRCRKSRWRGSAAAIRRARSSEPPSLPGVRPGCCSTSRRAFSSDCKLSMSFERLVTVVGRIWKARGPEESLILCCLSPNASLHLSGFPACGTPFFTFVNLEGILHGHIFMDNGAYRLNHSDRRVGLKNVPSHID